MKKSYFKWLGVFAVIALLALVIDYSLGVRTFDDVAVAMAISPVVSETVTTEVVEAEAPDLLINDIDQEIEKIGIGRFPLNVAMRNISRTRKIESQISEYFSCDTKEFNDTVKTAVTATGQAYFPLVVNNIDMWSVHDNIMLVGIPAYDAAGAVNPRASLTGYISKIEKSSETLHIQPTNGLIALNVSTLKAADNIAVDTKLVRLGRAEDELAMQTASYALFPASDTQYAQNFMSMVQQSEFDRITKKVVKWGFSDFSEANIKDTEAQHELTLYFGAKSMFIDKESGKRVYTSGGATHFVTKELEWQDSDFATAAAADAWFVALTKAVFQGTSGSQIRHGYLGPDVMGKLNAIPYVQKKMEANNTEEKFGLTFSVITTNFGTLKLIKSDLLGEVQLGDYGFIFDMTKLEDHVFIPTKETELDLKKAGISNSNATVIQRVSCPIFKNPDCHLILHKA